MTEHGRGRYWDDFKVGEVLVTGRRTVDGGDVSRFAGLTGDFNPLGDTVHTEMTVREAKPSSRVNTLARAALEMP